MLNIAKRRLFCAILCCLTFLLLSAPVMAADNNLVYEAKLEGEISQHMVSYLERVHQEEIGRAHV